MRCCFQDLFNIDCSIIVQFPFSFFLILFVSSHVVHPYWTTDTTAARKKLLFILSDRLDLLIMDSLSIPVHAFARCILMTLSEDEMLLPRNVNLATNFREPQFKVEMSPFGLKHMYSVLSAFTCWPMPPAACSRLSRRNSA